MTDDGLNLHELEVPGYIWIKMKAEDTEQNRLIHAAFREMAEIECKNDYTMALGKLLEYYQEDAKVQMLYEKVTLVEDRVTKVEEALTKKPEPQDEENDGVF